MGLRYRYHAWTFLDFGEHIYAVNNTKENVDAHQTANNRFNIIKAEAQRTFSYLITILIVFLTSGFQFLIYPMWQLIYAGQRIWLLPMLIPGTSLDTAFQYGLNLSYQIVCTCMALAGPIGFDSFFTVCCCHHTMCVSLIGSTLDEMEKLSTKTIDLSQTRKMHLINFLKQLQDLDK